MTNQRNNSDIKILNEIAKCNCSGDPQEAKLDIFDSRPQMNAHGNRLKGGGYENTDHYTNCTLTFCDIGNIHAVSNCFIKMIDIPNTPSNFNSIENYGPKV